MTDTAGPSAPSPEPAGGSPTPAAPTTTPSSSPVPAWSSFSAASRLVIVGSATIVVATLIGIVVGAWRFDPIGLIFVVLGLAAGASAWSAETGPAATRSRLPLPALQLAAGVVMAALSLLAIIEMLGDYDDLDDFGGIVGVVMAVIVVGASLAVLWGALKNDAEWRSRLRSGDQGTRIAMLGVGLVFLAWVWHLTIGFWAFAPVALGLGAIVLAGVILFVRDKLGLPFPAAWISVILGLYGAYAAFNQWNSLMDLGASRLELGLFDFIPFFVYVIGVLLVIGGAVLTAVEGQRAMAARSAAPPGDTPA